MAEPTTGRPHRAGRRLGRVLAAVLGGALLAASAGATVLQWQAPDVAAQIVGEAHQRAQAVVGERGGDGYPVIEQGGPGGLPELHRCTRAFIEMVSYREPGIPPSYAAHNLCGGDILLGWSVGQRVHIKGRDSLYVVTAIHDIDKLTATTDDLRTVEGTLILQTCFYGVLKMRLVGLSPLVQ